MVLRNEIRPGTPRKFVSALSMAAHIIGLKVVCPEGLLVFFVNGYWPVRASSRVSPGIPDFPRNFPGIPLEFT